MIPTGDVKLKQFPCFHILFVIFMGQNKNVICILCQNECENEIATFKGLSLVKGQ